MAIRVSCPSCKADVHVDDTLAGKDIICPSCRGRVTVPSIAAGSPEARAGAPAGDEYDDDDRIREGQGEPSLPRWSDRDDYDLPRRHDPTRWSATLTGLAMIFWTSIVSVVIIVIIAGIGFAMGSNPQMMFGGGGGAQPGAEMMAMALVVSGLGCVLLILFIIAFVGLCMCCTVPSESGAKGRAITTVILICVSVVMFIVYIVAVAVMAVNQVQMMGAPPPPGQLPFSPATFMVITIVGAIDVILIVTLWLMFHKAIADHFRNSRLSRGCVWYLIAFVVYQIGAVILQFIAYPILQGGNVMVMPMNTPGMIVTQIWGVVWMVGLSTAYLLIVRETRRSIQEDQAAVADGDAMEADGR